MRSIAKVTAAFALVAAILCAQDEPPVVLTLEQASSRSGKDFAPAYNGRLIKVSAQVSDLPLAAIDQLLLPLRDDEDFGLFAEGTAAQFAGLAPGDTVEAVGRLRRSSGMPVLALIEIRKTGKAEPLGSRQMSISEAAGLRNLALPIEIEGRVTSVTETGSAEILTVFDGQTSVPVMLYKQRRDDERRLSQLRAGDQIRVAGLLMQDAQLPPYDRLFTLVIRGPEAVSLLESGGMIPAYLLLSAVLGIGLLAIIWWIRDQRTRGFRSTMTTLHGVGEEILAATSLSEMLKKLETVVPPAARVSGCTVYLYNRKNKTLEQVHSGSRTSNKKPVAVEVERDSVGGVLGGAALCFRNRATLSIPDTRRSELFKSDPVGAATPRSLLYLPMMAQDEIVGVIQLHRDGGVRYFQHEEQASAQHLANQVAASLRLLEQRSIREQLFKSEKLAATGQLIAGVVNDLRNPVESLLTLSQLLLFRGRSEERDLKMLAAEAQRTAEIVTRLISFGRNEDAVAAPVELNALLTGLYKFREREWREAGIQLQDRASREAVHVIGAQGQLEQVFLNILLYAERAVAESGSKIITAGTALLGRRVLVDISFPAPEDAADPFLNEDDGGAGGLAVVRGIIQSHGGEVRFEQINNGTAGRIEIELPRAEMASRNGSDPVSKRRAALTAVILEPDPVAQRAFVSLLAQRGHRVIPLGSAEEAIDLVQRVKCELIAATSSSSSRLPGFNWVNFYEKVRPHTDGFVLLTDSAEIGHTFRPGEGFVIRKPLHEADINRVLDEFESASAPVTAEAS